MMTRINIGLVIPSYQPMTYNKNIAEKTETPSF